jgi:hypothetical protein
MFPLRAGGVRAGLGKAILWSAREARCLNVGLATVAGRRDVQRTVVASRTRHCLLRTRTATGSVVRSSGPGRRPRPGAAGGRGEVGAAVRPGRTIDVRRPAAGAARAAGCVGRSPVERRSHHGPRRKLVCCSAEVADQLRRQLGCSAVVIDTGPHVDMERVSHDLSDRAVGGLMTEGRGNIHPQFLTAEPTPRPLRVFIRMAGCAGSTATRTAAGNRSRCPAGREHRSAVLGSAVLGGRKRDLDG